MAGVDEMLEKYMIVSQLFLTVQSAALKKMNLPWQLSD
jgi:hypothetical protein